jgi:hypothetical protein
MDAKPTLPRDSQKRAWANATRAWLIVIFALIAFGSLMWGIR